MERKRKTINCKICQIHRSLPNSDICSKCDEILAEENKRIKETYWEAKQLIKEYNRAKTYPHFQLQNINNDL